MKKTLVKIFVLAFATAFITVGCGLKTDKNNQTENSSSEIIEVTTQGTVATGSTVAPSSASTSVSTTKAASKVTLPKDLKLVFSSGVGAWSSEINLKKDGSFKGSYHDADMGSAGEKYPGGTVYICEFNGTFSYITKIDDKTYKMTLKTVKQEKKAGTTWIEGDVQYVYSDPVGLEGKTFYLCLPGKNMKSIDKDYILGLADGVDTPLKTYALINMSEEKTAFVEYK